MAALSGKTAKVKVTAVTPTSSTDEAVTKLSSGVFQITAAAKRHWDRNSTGAVGVYIGAVLQGSSEYAVNPVEGVVSFATGYRPETAETVTLDPHYYTASYLGQTRSWSADFGTDMLDVTAFATSTSAAQWRTMIPGLTGGTIELGRFVSTGSTVDTEPVMFDGQWLGAELVVELHMSDDDHLAGFAYVDADAWENEVDGQPAETVSLTVDGPFYYSTST